MWEEPRPERLREVGGERRGVGVWVLVAALAILGVTAILLNSGAQDLIRAFIEHGSRFAPVAEKESPAPATQSDAAEPEAAPGSGRAVLGPANARQGDAGVLEGLAALYPDLADPLLAVVGRLYDLHALTRQNYYHPNMLGSWSIKAVLPTIAPELDYSTVGEIHEGGAASEAFLELLDPTVSPVRREALRKALVDYCKLDTLALVRLSSILANMPMAR